VDERELWAGKITLAFDELPPFAAPGRVWTTLTPTPVSRFSVSFSGDVDGVPQLRTGPATMQIDGSPYEHSVVVSRVESHALIGRFNGPPPVPSGGAVSVEFGVLNLDPNSLWLEEMVVGDWTFRLTAVADLAHGREQLRDVLGVAETHDATLCRSDGSSFAASEAMRVLDGWRLAMSFATGSRIGLWRQLITCPSGMRDDGWRAFASPSVSPWHDHHRIIDAHDSTGIAELVRLVLDRRAAVGADRAAIDELAMNFALEANGTAPTEMRIAASGAGLELLAWDQLVEDAGDGAVSKAERKRSYSDRAAAENIAVLLSRARIDPSVPAVLEPYASVGAATSGAVAVAALRNRVMHPRRREGELSLPGSVWAEGSQLAVQYLELLILHRLGYLGRYSDRFRSGWVGTTFDVPWGPVFAEFNE